MNRRQKTWLALFLVAALSGFLAARDQTDGWLRYRTPEEAGWSTEKLAAVCRNSNAASVFLVRNGRVVFTYGDCRRRFKVHSMRKSILSALFGIAVAEKKIDLQKNLAELGISDKTPLSEGEGRARVLDLLKARSGIYLPAAGETSFMKNTRPARGSHAAGEHFYYNNWDFNALGTIYRRQTGRDIFADFERRIARPLGMQDFTLIDCCYNSEEMSLHPAYAFMMSARDLARFGQLYLQLGEWRGKRIVPEGWVRESTTGVSEAGDRNIASDDALRYGYLWWVIDPYRGQRIFYAAGTYGQRVIVVPALKAVLVLQANSYLAEGISDVDFVVDDILFHCRSGAPAAEPRFLPLEEPAAAKGMRLRARAQEKYCKTYSHGGATFSVKREESRLVLADFMPNYRFRLLPLTPKLFHVNDIGMYLFFSLDGRGIPQQARIHKSPLAKEMLDAIIQSGIEKAKERFPEWRGRISSREEMIDLALELEMKGIDNTEILKLNAELFPFSFHAQQALNKALQKKGGLAVSDVVFGEIVNQLHAQSQKNTKTEWLYEIIHSQADPRPVAEEEMDNYAGDFGQRHVARDGQELVYFTDPGQKARLFRIRADEFSIQDQFYRRLRFVRDERGRAIKLVVGHYRDSFEESVRTGVGSATTAAVATFVSSPEQERAVKALIRSIRERGGRHRGSAVYVVTADFEKLPCGSLKQDGVEILPLEMDRSFLDYPLAIKAFAAAQVEKKADAGTDTLIWLDPGVIVLKSLEALDLGKDFDVAVRPVTLANTIGIPPLAVPNDYWEPIYKETGLDYRTLPALETIADTVKIQPYFNCEVFSFNPRLGIAAEWARMLARFLKNGDYQKTVCSTFLRKLFLHQAVLSAVIASRVKRDRIKALPITSGYPFSQHMKLPVAKMASSLDEVAVVIFDRTWQQDGKWLERIPVCKQLHRWLSDVYSEYLPQ